MSIFKLIKKVRYRTWFIIAVVLIVSVVGATVHAHTQRVKHQEAIEQEQERNTNLVRVEEKTYKISDRKTDVVVLARLKRGASLTVHQKTGDISDVFVQPLNKIQNLKLKLVAGGEYELIASRGGHTTRIVITVVDNRSKTKMTISESSASAVESTVSVAPQPDTEESSVASETSQTDSKLGATGQYPVSQYPGYDYNTGTEVDNTTPTESSDNPADNEASNPEGDHSLSSAPEEDNAGTNQDDAMDS